MADIPKSLYSNTLTVMGVELVVHVLDDGQRIIEAAGMQDLCEAMLSNPISAAEAEKLARAISSPAAGR